MSIVGRLEHGEYDLLCMRFDWFCGVQGEGSKREEMWNSNMRAALIVMVFPFFFRVFDAQLLLDVSFVFTYVPSVGVPRTM